MDMLELFKARYLPRYSGAMQFQSAFYKCQESIYHTSHKRGKKKKKGIPEYWNRSQTLFICQIIISRPSRNLEFTTRFL